MGPLEKAKIYQQLYDAVRDQSYKSYSVNDLFENFMPLNPKLRAVAGTFTSHVRYVQKQTQKLRPKVPNMKEKNSRLINNFPQRIL